MDDDPTDYVLDDVNAGDGLMIEDDGCLFKNTNGIMVPSSTKYDHRTGARTFVWSKKVVVIKVAVLLAAGVGSAWLYDRNVNHRWEAPFMWNPCSEVLEEYPEDLWYDMLDSVDAPFCSSALNNNYDSSLCTYSRERLHLYFHGRYYQTKDTISRDSSSGVNYYCFDMEERGVDGSLGAIWEDNTDCDALGLEGWDVVCQGDPNNNNNQEDDDGQAAEVVDCARNSLSGYVWCQTSGINYDYYGDGRFKRDGSGSKGDWAIVDIDSGTATFTYNTKNHG